MADEDLGRLKIDKTPSAVRPGRRRKRFLWPALLLLLLLTALLLWWAGVLTPAASVEIVTVPRIYPSQGLTVLNASGYVVAQRKAAVASQVTGRLVWLGVEEGSRVTKGRSSRVWKTGEAQRRRGAGGGRGADRAGAGGGSAGGAAATRGSVRTDGDLLAAGFCLARPSTIRPRPASARAEATVRAAQTAETAAVAARRRAAVGLDYTYLRAPFDAVVLTKNADLGDIVTPLGAAANAKAAVVTHRRSRLAAGRSRRLRVQPQPHPGRPAVRNQARRLPRRALSRRGAQIVPTADRSKATVMVKVRFLNSTRGSCRR